jgi:DNA modification methylase
VLDPFAGSGTTLIAAERTGRTARLIELDPKYCDVIVRRWQAETGREAILESDGRSFAEVQAERLGEDAEASADHAEGVP